MKKTPETKEPTTALEYALLIKKGVIQKANENKFEANLLFTVVLASTIFAPLFILIPYKEIIGDQPAWIEFLSKVVPATLTSIAALGSGWLQLRKPQERWGIYRTAQREIEFEIDQHRFSLGQYSAAEKKDGLLADIVSRRALKLHFEWMQYIPNPDDIGKLTPGKKNG